MMSTTIASAPIEAAVSSLRKVVAGTGAASWLTLVMPRSRPVRSADRLSGVGISLSSAPSAAKTTVR